MLLWMVACYVSFTFLSARDPRYILYWLPPFVYFAAWPAIAVFSHRRLRLIAAAACLLMVAGYGWQAARSTSYPHLSGYSELAQWLNSSTQGRQRILFDGSHNGNFIFYVRLHDPARRFVVIRKGLYVMRIIKYFGSQELVQTPEQLRDVLSQYGIRYVVVSDDPESVFFPVQATLREMLHSSQFKLVREFPVVFGYRSLRQNRLLVYENQQAAAPSTQELRVPMMTLGGDIVVPLDDLGNP
jgi:hypothetical protein